MGSLGDRIKRYEATQRNYATPRMPLMIRVDGRAFHSFTSGCKKPFDTKIMSSMVNAAVDVASDMHGFKAGYVQSDEATFCLTDYDKIESQGWFDYNLPKVISISAALMSVCFMKHYGIDSSPATPPVFDSRAFNIPREDVVNAFLWRAKDWERNSLQMYCRAFFSHKELFQKKRSDMHEMLHGIGRNWATETIDTERNGTFIIKGADGVSTRTDVLPSFDSINSAIGGLF